MSLYSGFSSALGLGFGLSSALSFVSAFDLSVLVEVLSGSGLGSEGVGVGFEGGVALGWVFLLGFLGLVGSDLEGISGSFLGSVFFGVSDLDFLGVSFLRTDFNFEVGVS